MHDFFQFLYLFFFFTHKNMSLYSLILWAFTSILKYGYFHILCHELELFHSCCYSMKTWEQKQATCMWTAILNQVFSRYFSFKDNIHVRLVSECLQLHNVQLYTSNVQFPLQIFILWSDSCVLTFSHPLISLF